jgi:hypothetical protein
MPTSITVSEARCSKADLHREADRWLVNPWDRCINITILEPSVSIEEQTSLTLSTGEFLWLICSLSVLSGLVGRQCCDD